MKTETNIKHHTLTDLKALFVLAALLSVVAATSAASALAAPAAVSAASEDVLDTLRPEHPRLMLTVDDLDRLRADHSDDAAFKKCIADVIAAADKAMGKAPMKHKLIGPRLLYVSRDCLNRIYTLGLAWRWTGQEAYARKAEENLLTVCAFPDWNPSHFLDTAEMSHAVGVGYDWFFEYLSEESRNKISDGLIRLGLEPGLTAYGLPPILGNPGGDMAKDDKKRKQAWWVRSAFNWNQVCNCGLVIGALAIAETDPGYARAMIPAMRASLPKALKTYEPDGAWPEGPSYWNYATSYTVYGLAALHSSLGTDFGISDHAGLAAAGRFPVELTGPAGLFVNFADCGERGRRKTLIPLFWLARRYDDPFLAQVEHAAIMQNRASPFHVIWYVPPPEDVQAPPLERVFGGSVEIAVFRSEWDDPGALFATVKAGYNQVNHGHLDLGNFELDALGVRWARDLGSDNYNLPGYWDRRRGGKRWQYYRLNGFSHNICLLAGKDQDPMGKARVVKSGADDSGGFAEGGGFAVIDVTSAYAHSARSALRGVALVCDRKAMLVQDEFEIEKACEVAWGMTTDAAVTVKKGGAAHLKLEGRELVARILSPKGAEFLVESAEQEPPQKTNKGVNRLMIRLPDQKGSVRVAVLLAPVWKDGAVAPQKIEPLANW